MVLGRDGAVVESHGALAGADAAAPRAAAVMSVLRDTNCLLKSSTDGRLRTVTVAFRSETYLISLDDTNVYVALVDSPPGAGGDDSDAGGDAGAGDEAGDSGGAGDPATAEDV